MLCPRPFVKAGFGFDKNGGSAHPIVLFRQMNPPPSIYTHASSMHVHITLIPSALLPIHSYRQASTIHTLMRPRFSNPSTSIQQSTHSKNLITLNRIYLHLGFRKYAVTFLCHVCTGQPTQGLRVKQQTRPHLQRVRNQT